MQSADVTLAALRNAQHSFLSEELDRLRREIERLRAEVERLPQRRWRERLSRSSFGGQGRPSVERPRG
jgi:hypothetical protein